jgi:PIN domain nuclease of toxin-antitoxin system
MKLLLDTCAFLWFQAAAEDLSKTARAAILDPANDVYLSAVSAWEIARKFAAGSLRLDTSP